MEDLFKKFLYTGIGLAVLTKEHLEKSLDELVSNQKLSKEEGKKIFDEVMQKTASKKGAFEEQFRKMTEEVMGNFNFAKSREVEELKKRVTLLEAKLNKAKVAEAPVDPKVFKTAAAKGTAPVAKKKKVKKADASE